MINKHRLFLPVILISASVLFSACAHQGLFGPAENQQDTTEQTSESETNNPLEQITQALQTGQAMRCEVTDPNSQYQAEYLVNNGQFKVTSTDPETQMTSHVLTKDNASYIWVDGENTGYMYSFDPEETELSDTLEQYRQQAANIGEETSDDPDMGNMNDYQIDCTGASFTQGEFELPSNVEFINPAEIMQQPFDGAADDSTESGQSEGAGGNNQMTPEQQQSYQEMIEQLQQSQ